MFYVITNKWQVPLKGILVVTYEDIILTTTDDELLFNTLAENNYIGGEK
jgi:hypothetical protein